MSLGTYKPNILHRLGNAWDAIKGVPNPGLFYPPQQRGSGIGPINWPGWTQWERENQEEGRKDLVRAKVAVNSPWVYADVQAIANEFSTAELVIKERRGTKLEDVDNHPLEKIWESPNEHMGRSFVAAFWAWSYVLVGKAYLYWVPDTSGTELMEVWPVPPWMIRPIPDKDNFISGYAFKSSPYSDMIVIPPEMMTYSHSVNIFDIRDGLSFLVAADNEIKADLAASAWNLNFFDDRNGLPDGMVSLAADALDQDVERVRMELRDFFGGTQRGIAVARSNDMKWQEFSRSQKDMEFTQGREFASKVIGRTLGFPDGYWSDLANRANAEQARRTMISGAVWPLLVRLAEDMNAARRGVVQRWYGEDTRAEFEDIRGEDKEAQAKELKAYEPFLTLNDLREMIGKKAMDKDDPRGLMLVAEIAKAAPIPGTPAAKLLEDQQAKKDEDQAKQIAAQVEAGTIPDPNEELSQVDKQAPEPLPDAEVPEGDAAMLADEAAVKAQSDEERAMFAKMGGGQGKGKGYDKAKSVLKPQNSKGERVGGGGGGSASEGHTGHAVGGGSSGSSAGESTFESKSFADADAADAWAREEGKAWGKKLPLKEKLALSTYQGGEYRMINDGLRNDGKPPAKYNATVKAMDSAIAKHTLSENVTVHRGMDFDRPGAREAIDRMEVGKTYSDKAYMSTTFDKNITHVFNDRETPGASMEIRVPKGNHAAYMNAANDNPHVSQERELLLPRNTQYRVVSKTPTDTDCHVVLEVLP